MAKFIKPKGEPSGRRSKHGQRVMDAMNDAAEDGEPHPSTKRERNYGTRLEEGFGMLSDDGMDGMDDE